MAGKYAAGTSVPVEKTRAEIEQVLARYGASAFGYMADQAYASGQMPPPMLALGQGA